MSFKSKKVETIIKTEVDDLGRKKYQLEEYEVQVADSDNLLDLKGPLANLVPRQSSLNIEKLIGKSAGTKKKPFYCEVCDQQQKCDISFLTHLNSAAHNKKIGMSLRVKAPAKSAIMDKIHQIQALKQQQILRKEKQQEEALQIMSSRSSISLKKPQISTPLETKISPSSLSIHKYPQEQPEDSERNEQQKKKEQNSQEEKESNVKNEEQEDIETELKKYGLPSSFGSKRRKR